jgi:hypothetical protein
VPAAARRTRTLARHEAIEPPVACTVSVPAFVGRIRTRAVPPGSDVTERRTPAPRRVNRTGWSTCSEPRGPLALTRRASVVACRAVARPRIESEQLWRSENDVESGVTSTFPPTVVARERTAYRPVDGKLASGNA